MGVRGPDPYHPQRAQGTVGNLAFPIRILLATGALYSSCFIRAAEPVNGIGRQNAELGGRNGPKSCPRT